MIRPAKAALALHGGPPVRSERLPLHRPSFGPEELAAVAKCLRTGEVGGDGPRGRELERRLQEFLGVERVLLVTSCTSALETAMMITGMGPGAEVIVPSFTFVSAANAVVRAGARPVFVDIEDRHCNLDPILVAAAVSPATRAVVPVHYAGMATAMEPLLALAQQRGLVIVEDAAHAMNARYRGRPLGALGSLGCLSFHETKDLVCGEGGALVVRDDKALAREAEIVREKGTDRAAFMRGERDKYSWVALGSSYVISDVLAAIALEQFKKVDEITRRKTEHAQFYLERLAPYAGMLRLPAVPEGAVPNWHLFAVQVDPTRRDWMLQALKAEGVSAAFHYVPLHSAPFGVSRGGRPGPLLPVTARVSASLVRLPLFATMTSRDRDDVVAAVDKIAADWDRGA